MTSRVMKIDNAAISPDISKCVVPVVVMHHIYSRTKDVEIETIIKTHQDTQLCVSLNILNTQYKKEFGQKSI